LLNFSPDFALYLDFDSLYSSIK